MAEYLLKDLNNEAEHVLGIDAENYPWFSVCRKDGKYCLVENNFSDNESGHYPYRCNTIGIPWRYDKALFFDLWPIDYPTLFYRLYNSNRGYLAMSHNGLWSAWCLDAFYGCTTLIEDSSWEEFQILFRGRLGFFPRSWIELSEWGPKFTPDKVLELKDNQVFVFGSNLRGNHLGGAAKDALKFGAEMGKGVGIQGNSYAIPTMNMSNDDIVPYVNDFLEYARKHPEKEFLVTKVGCGIAGKSVADIAPMFSEAMSSKNIILPKDFYDYLIG